MRMRNRKKQEWGGKKGGERGRIGNNDEVKRGEW